MKKILVTGGCGFIGSHTIVDLIEHGFEPYSIDNLVNSTTDPLEGIEKITGKKVKNYDVDLCDLEATRAVFREHPDTMGVIHFAALKWVGESVEEPIRYYRNNMNSLLNILQCMDEFEVPFFIFSSSCSVYGNAADLPVTENTRFEKPESPYAGTKQAGENLIREYAFIRPKKKVVMLRYFNPAGAHESGFLGEAPSNPSTNLVPVITETAIGKRKEVVVFGNDYDTRDGSCLRDYIHIMDLADAHTRSLKYIMEGKNDTNCESFNLGIGEGVTVLEAIHAFESVTGQSLNYRIGPRRFGDVAAIYANYDKAARQLGWKPQRNIEDIMRSAWEWEQKQAVSSGVR